MVMVTNERRRSIRLKDYDYAQVGAYFVTIVVQDRKCLFGEIIGGVLQLNAAGLMVQAVWEDLSNHYAGIDPDAFVVMPNHIHGIVVLVGTEAHAIPTSEGQPQGVAPTRTGAKMSLSDVVHRFKTLTTKRYIDESLTRIRQYILDNPARWEFDRENPLATRPESKDAWRTGQ
jgi:REP element-mobilizing transposase RayT